MKLFRSKPAPARRATAGAHSTATNVRRAREGDNPPEPVRPPCLRASAGSFWEIFHTGTTAETRPLRIETLTVKIRTRASICISSKRGMPGGAAASSVRRPTIASAKPRRGTRSQPALTNGKYRICPSCRGRVAVRSAPTLISVCARPTARCCPPAAAAARRASTRPGRTCVPESPASPAANPRRPAISRRRPDNRRVPCARPAA
jgi:hypothetical protein